MLRSISTLGTLTGNSTRRTDGRPDGTRFDSREGEILEAARPRGEPERDARLLLREAARAPAERQARCRRRRHREETSRAPDHAARAERRQARDPGAAGARRGTRRPRPPGAREEDGSPAAAARAGRAGHWPPEPAGEADRLG